MSKPSRVYIVRYGAFGDSLVITPVLRALKEQGHHIILEYSDRGEAVFRHNPHIDEHVFYKADSVPIEQLNKYWLEQKEKHKADKYINFSETLEVALALHPRSPRYNYSKSERALLCNKNYYEYSMKHAGINFNLVFPDDCQKYSYMDEKNPYISIYKENQMRDFYKPELFFTKDEELDVKQYLKSNHFNIVFNMSGSGKNKAYPWSDIVIGSILNDFPNAHIITIGDYMSKMIELHADRVTNLCGEIDIRMSMLLTKHADLLISPDTGVLHASGCFSTPKIGLLGHTTKENITKHFENDYSIEADQSRAECSPCFRLIYNAPMQCPRDISTGGVYCMSKGIQPEMVYDRVKEVIAKHSKAVKLAEV